MALKIATRSTTAPERGHRKDVATPVQPGTNEVIVTVSVTYLIR